METNEKSAGAANEMLAAHIETLISIKDVLATHPESVRGNSVVHYAMHKIGSLIATLEGKPNQHVFYDREDGLAHCKVCNGAEGSLPASCPGEKMSSDQEEAVYAGLLDFVSGAWVPGKSLGRALDAMKKANL